MIIEDIIEYERSLSSKIQEIKIEEKKLKKIIFDLTCADISKEELLKMIAPRDT